MRDCMPAYDCTVIKCTIRRFITSSNRRAIVRTTDGLWCFFEAFVLALAEMVVRKRHISLRNSSSVRQTKDQCDVWVMWIHFYFLVSIKTERSHERKKNPQKCHNYTWLCANIHRRMSRSWWSIVQSEYGDAICTAWSVSIGWFTLMRRGAHLQLLMRSAIRRHEQKGKHGTPQREKMKTNSVN